MGPFQDGKNTPSFQYWQLDPPFEMWFPYWLRYRAKVSANKGVSFGIRPKRKYCIVASSNVCYY